MSNMEATSRRGGKREGAGRPVGRRNDATIAREKALKEALNQMLAELTPAEIKTIQPLSVLLFAMRAHLAQGDLVTAASIARQAADFCHAKVTSAPIDTALPADLEPDPEPTPDEPGPPNPIL